MHKLGLEYWEIPSIWGNLLLISTAALTGRFVWNWWVVYPEIDLSLSMLDVYGSITNATSQFESKRKRVSSCSAFRPRPILICTQLSFSLCVWFGIVLYLCTIIGAVANLFVHV